MMVKRFFLKCNGLVKVTMKLVTKEILRENSLCEDIKRIQIDGNPKPGD